MSAAETYIITRPGAQFTRWEWPDGEPVKGPVYEHKDRATRQGEYQLISREGSGKSRVYPVVRHYGRPGRGKMLLVAEIKLTPKEAGALAHLGLRRKIDVAPEVRAQLIKGDADTTKKPRVPTAQDQESLTMAAVFAGREVTNIEEALAILKENNVPR